MATNSLTATYAVFDCHGDRAPRPLFDYALYAAHCEQEGWADAYEGGPAEQDEDLAGLTILEKPHIDVRGSVSGMPLFNHE